MNILVTGGAGFIASHIVDKYISLGHRIIVVDHNLKNKSYLNSKAQYIESDIDDKKIEDIFRDNKIDVINHHAAQISVEDAEKFPEENAKTNILGTLHLLEMARKYKIKKFIFSSSAALYGNVKQLPVTENTLTNPNSQYGISKLCAEKYVLLYNQLYDLDITIFRYANAYGPRQKGGVIALCTQNILQNKPLAVRGDGETTRDFVFVEDIAEVNALVLTKQTQSKIFNVSTNTKTSINNFITFLSDITKITPQIIKTQLIAGEIINSRLDNTLIFKELQWKPKTSFKEGLQKTIVAFEKEYNHKELGE